MKLRKLYLYVTDDEYETPIYICASLSELAQKLNKSYDATSCCFSRSSPQYKIVWIEEEEEDD